MNIKTGTEYKTEMSKYKKQAFIYRLLIWELTENYFKQIETLKNETIKTMKKENLLPDKYNTVEEILRFIIHEPNESNYFFFEEIMEDLKIIEKFYKTSEKLGIFRVSDIAEFVKSRKFLFENIGFNETEYKIFYLICIDKKNDEIKEILNIENPNKVISSMGAKLLLYLKKKNKLEYLINNGYIERHKDEEKIKNVRKTLKNLFISGIIAEL